MDQYIRCDYDKQFRLESECTVNIYHIGMDYFLSVCIHFCAQCAKQKYSIFFFFEWFTLIKK